MLMPTHYDERNISTTGTTTECDGDNDSSCSISTTSSSDDDEEELVAEFNDGTSATYGSNNTDACTHKD
jgi:hypothetical protein